MGSHSVFPFRYCTVYQLFFEKLGVLTNKDTTDITFRDKNTTTRKTKQVDFQPDFGKEEVTCGACIHSVASGRVASCQHEGCVEARATQTAALT